MKGTLAPAGCWVRGAAILAGTAAGLLWVGKDQGRILISELWRRRRDCALILESRKEVVEVFMGTEGTQVITGCLLSGETNSEIFGGKGLILSFYTHTQTPLCIS